MLELRKGLDPMRRRELSLLAQQRCLGLELFAAARVVALHSPIRNEIATDLLINESLSAAKIVLLPAITPQGMVFRRLRSLEELVCGRFGICEPPEGMEVYLPEAIDFFLVPGVAFDLEGRRIGYGKGYYDRTLHMMEGSGRLAGYGYDFQLLESIAGAPHDVRMDLVITDRRMVSPLGQFT
jgi:5-formyltetrahydrofolate cyclo-ligase